MGLGGKVSCPVLDQGDCNRLRLVADPNARGAIGPSAIVATDHAPDDLTP
jgi:hypothetical protein